MHHPLQYLVLGSMALSLLLTAIFDGQPRKPHSLVNDIAITMISLVVWWACGLFDL